MLEVRFFARDALQVAQDLLGKVIRVKYQRWWLSASIIETEAYYLNEKGSHSSLGFTEKRKALFMPAGTIYMYYARGGDSLNISCQGAGNAVLIKSGLPYQDDSSPRHTIKIMERLNPKRNQTLRTPERVCSGQTLLCRSLGLRVTEWDQQVFNPHRFFIEDCGYTVNKIIQTRRLGIPSGRDEHLLYRFIDYQRAEFCTDNPLRKRRWQLNQDYFIKNPCPFQPIHIQNLSRRLP